MNKAKTIEDTKKDLSSHWRQRKHGKDLDVIDSFPLCWRENIY